jgi:hypothetical protein
MSVTANTSKLQLASLDFDSIKTNLIAFLQGQSQFADYDFTGSAFNVLIDMLAYNTHYNAIYLNLVANEMFLDTAVLRSTVVSHAKALGYTPRSAVSSLATVNVAITRGASDNTSILTLPRFSQFSSDSLNGVSYNFVTLDDDTVGIQGNTFNFNDVQIVEGSPVVKTFIADSATNPKQSFNIVDANVDTAAFQVIVQTSQTNTSKKIFTLATDLTLIDSNSAVYFLEEGADASYNIYFGDGVLGQALSDGNILVVSYVTNNADAPNGLAGFALQSQLLAGATSNVVVVNAAAGGAPIEDVASIKFAAPKAYIAQNRAITVNDYVALINKNYPYFDAVTVWGGETEVPPVYGKVFISAKPKNGFGITEQQKQIIIQDVIAPISILTVTPQFVDPDFNYLNLSFDVDYDSTQTALTPIQLVNTITSAVELYAGLNLNTFNSEFRLSRLLRAVDDSENSVLSSTCAVYIQKKIIPALTASQTYVVNTGTQLHQGTGTSNRLYSSPSFTINDVGGTARQAFVEETPNSFSGLDNVQIVIPGEGYTSAPALTVTGDGVGANAFCTIVNGVIRSVIIDDVGSEYTTASVTATGGGGLGAEFSAILQGAKGILRTYYYDQNNNKTIINDNAGSIDYVNGIITLNDFNPTAINDEFGVLNIYVQPQNLIFGSSRNIILTLDPTDPNAVKVQLNDENSH